MEILHPPRNFSPFGIVGVAKFVAPFERLVVHTATGLSPFGIVDVEKVVVPFGIVGVAKVVVASGNLAVRTATDLSSFGVVGVAKVVVASGNLDVRTATDLSPFESLVVHIVMDLSPFVEVLHIVTDLSPFVEVLHIVMVLSSLIAGVLLRHILRRIPHHHSTHCFRSHHIRLRSSHHKLLQQVGVQFEPIFVPHEVVLLLSLFFLE